MNKEKTTKLTNATMSERAKTLDAARATLKAKFVGVDSTIDQLVDAVKLWWIAPEMLQRPVVVNIYGMTGVGKTDLVRELSRCIKMQHRLVEFDMNNASDHSHHDTVTEALEIMSLDDGDPGILLFDEMQRFNTIGSMGADVKDTKLSDFWELLSDGRIPQRSRERIQKAIDQITGYMDDDDIDNPSESNTRIKGKLKGRNALIVHRVLRRSVSLAAIRKMTVGEAVNRLREENNNPEAHEPVDYSQLLIILAGNLDDAFPGASQISEADVDADVFKSNADLVTVVDIKQALSGRFKPEQASRFGNNFVVCNTLSKASFTELIRRELDKSCKRINDVCGVATKYSDDFVSFVYRNGVYPAQGVRPVFTTIASVFDNVVIPRVADAKQTHGSTVLNITYDNATKEIVLSFQKPPSRSVASQRVAYHGQLDGIRDKIDPDTTASTAAHEAAHAVTTMVLTGIAPIQLLARTGEGAGNGFSLSHSIVNTEKTMLERITIFLAGAAGEELVYGSALVGTGHGNDLERATMLATSYTRKMGFSASKANYALDDHEFALNNDHTDAVVEKCIRKQRALAMKILKQHKKLLYAIAVALTEKGKLIDADLVELAAKYGVKAKALPQNAVVTAGYAEILRKKAAAVLGPTQRAKPVQKKRKK